MFRKMFIPVILIAALLLGCVVPAYAADTWICPACGHENPDRANFCGSCREPKPSTVVIGASNAWVCPECNEVCPDGNNFCMICGYEHQDSDQRALLISETEREELTISPVTYEEISFFMPDDTTYEYSYKAPCTGKYVFQNMNSSSRGISIQIYDAEGVKVDDLGLAKGDMGRTDLEEGREYTVRVPSYYGQGGTFDLRFYAPNPCTDIGKYDTVYDSIVTSYQWNRYEITPSISGLYYFWTDQMISGFGMRITIKDDLGYTVVNDGLLEQGTGVNARLTAGTTYSVFVYNSSIYNQTVGDYRMHICYPRDPVDISGDSVIGESMAYRKQENFYVLTAPVDGTYTFRMVNADNNVAVGFWITDLDGNVLVNGYELTQDKEFSVELKNGGVYTIKAVQSREYGPYSIQIIQP